MTDDLVKRLRAVLWSVNGEPNANGNVDETVCSEAADCIEALRIDRDRIAAEWAEVSQRNYQRAKKAEAVHDEWIKNAQTAIFEDSAELELITDEVKRLRTVLSDIELPVFAPSAGPSQPRRGRERCQMTDLLPCPFCGVEPVKVAVRDGYTIACAHGLCPGWTIRHATRLQWNCRARPELYYLLDLTDPNVVHANVLRGTIAKPSVEQIQHIYGRAFALNGGA